jgi:hypothetical protein
MGKQSAIDKIIQSLKVEIEMLEREITAKRKVIGDLDMARPFKKAKPSKPRRVEAQTA